MGSAQDRWSQSDAGHQLADHRRLPQARREPPAEPGDGQDGGDHEQGDQHRPERRERTAGSLAIGRRYR